MAKKDLENPALSLQEEMFSQLVVRLGNQSEAYRLAFNRADDTKKSILYTRGYEVAKRPHVKARIAEIARERLNEMTISPEWVVEQHRQMYEECRAAGAHASATRNLRAIGETMGIYKDNLMVTGDLRDLSDDEVRDKLVEALAKCEDRDMIKLILINLRSAWDRLKDEDKRAIGNASGISGDAAGERADPTRDRKPRS